MEQVKIFNDIPSDCEAKVNKWLVENADKAAIVRVL
jgi:hypothetical protein